MQLPAAVYEGHRSQDRRRGRVAFWLSIGLCVAALIGGAAAALTTARGFTVPSKSMANTIIPGDRIVVDRAAPIHRGDVIVEQQGPNAPLDYLRRVIGLPGDHVACCDPRGRITVNGKALDENYIYPGDPPSPTRFNITVPTGKLWLLGDHRSIAFDSRTTGPLAVQPVGRVFLVLRAGHPIFLRTLF